MLVTSIFFFSATMISKAFYFRVFKSRECVFEGIMSKHQIKINGIFTYSIYQYVEVSRNSHGADRIIINKKPVSFYSLSIVRYPNMQSPKVNRAGKQKVDYCRTCWSHDHKSFFMLNSAEHEISMLDKSHLINLLDELLI